MNILRGLPPFYTKALRVIFSYCTHVREIEEWEAAPGNPPVTLPTDHYTLYNQRHKVVGDIRIPSGFIPGQGNRFIYGDISLTAWSWSVGFLNVSSSPVEPIREHRFGFSRPLEFFYEDVIVGRISLKIAFGTNNIGFLTNTEEQYRSYTLIGRIDETWTVERAAIGREDEAYNIFNNVQIHSLISLMTARAINPRNLVFPTSIVSFNFQSPVVSSLSTAVLESKQHTFSEIAAEAYQERIQRRTADQQYGTQILTHYRPIPQNQRVRVLDPGRWLPVSLAETPEAAASRYHGNLYNNSFLNLLNAIDVGNQQYEGAADADFIYRFEKSTLGVFADIRSLQTSLYSYLPILAALLCRAENIRYRYLPYVQEVIRFYEQTRGLQRVRHYGVHGSYPWLNKIKTKYEQYLSRVFELIAVDLGANDPPRTLLQIYQLRIPQYNRWMSGESIELDWNVAKLGGPQLNTTRQRLQQITEFSQRIQWARIDAILTDAYLGDNTFSGDVTVLDPAQSINPGDIIELNFLDQSFISLRTVGATIAVTPENLDFSISVRRQWDSE